MIGNSYTSSNDLAGVIRDMGAGAGFHLEVETRAPDGWWWKDHAASAETTELIDSGEFDFIVMQEQSMVTSIGGMAARESRPAAVDIALTALRGGAQPVLFMTWGHRDGSSEAGHSSYSSMQIAIEETYRDIARAVAGELAAVGVAWRAVRTERPDINLYQPDGSHPSVEGTYLAAAVITATILDVDPKTFGSLTIEPEVADTLLDFATLAVG